MIKHHKTQIFVPGDLDDDFYITTCHPKIFNLKCCDGNFKIFNPITGIICMLKENISFFDKEYTIEYDYFVAEEGDKNV
jgi:hypothetical protein